MLFSHGSFGCVSFSSRRFFPCILMVELVRQSFSRFFFPREMSCRSVLVLVLVSSVRIGFVCSSSSSSRSSIKKEVS